MALLRITVDLESAGDVTQDTLEEIADKIDKYADSVVGPMYLADKQGEDKHVTYHVHASTDDYACQDCRELSRDQRH